MRARTHTDDRGVVYRSPVVASSKCGKYAYATKKLAKATAVRQSKESGEDIRAYHCYGCHSYHIGHPPGSRLQVA